MNQQTRADYVPVSDSGDVQILNDLLPSHLMLNLLYTSDFLSVKNRGYCKLGDEYHHLSRRHREISKKLIKRIYYLGGTPILRPDPVVSAQDMLAQLKDLLADELQVIAKYAAVIDQAQDEVTEYLLGDIQKDNEKRELWLRQQVGQSEAMGISEWLSLWV